MKKYAEINTSEFPIVKVVFTGEAADATNFPFYLEEVKQAYDHKNKLSIIFDATNAVFPGIAFQKMQAQWLNDNNEMMKNFCVGTAYIIPNIIIRNVLKAIFAFQSQPVPYLVCENSAQAEQWVSEQLQAS